MGAVDFVINRKSIVTVCNCFEDIFRGNPIEPLPNLQQFKKKIYLLDDSKFEILYSRGTGYIWDPIRLKEFPLLYKDTPWNLVLLYDRKMIATVGWFATVNAILISQLQGVHGCRGFLSQIKWERMLVDLVLQKMKVWGYTQVRIQPGERNSYYARTELNEESRRRNESLIMRYDITARRMGFKICERTREYTRTL